MTLPDPDSRLPRGGFNAYDIRYSDAPWSAQAAWVSKINDRYIIATTQAHFTMDGRDLLRESSLEEYKNEKDRLAEERQKQGKENPDLSLYPDYDYRHQGIVYA